MRIKKKKDSSFPTLSHKALGQLGDQRKSAQPRLGLDVHNTQSRMGKEAVPVEQLWEGQPCPWGKREEQAQPRVLTQRGHQ